MPRFTSFCMTFRPARLRRAGRFLSLALLVAGCAAVPPARDAGIVVREIAADYADVRDALDDAIRDEGLVAPTSSRFGEMLARTASDLGHRADVYGEAEIFSFCSARISARLVAEDVRHIALCPLTIALYTLPQRAGLVYLAYRPPALASPAGTLARALLDDVAERTAARTRR